MNLGTQQKKCTNGLTPPNSSLSVSLIMRGDGGLVALMAGDGQQ